MKVIVGTRGSNLALTQTNKVIDMLKEVHPDIEFEVRIIKTKGDIIKDLPIDQIGGKEIFVKEIEAQLLNGSIDMAVHSMKDMPGELPRGLKLSFTPKREDYRDVLVSRKGIKSLDDLPRGAKIGTGSKRRKYQILSYRKDLEIVPIRGNVETRIKKIEKENLDGVILAAAGIKRLGLDLGDRVFPIDKNIMLPSPCQGILALEIKENDENMDSIIKKLSHKETEIQGRVERAFLKAVGGSCHLPVGAYCEVLEGKIIVEGLLGSEEGDILIKKSMETDLNLYKEAGVQLAEKIMKEMAQR